MSTINRRKLMNDIAKGLYEAKCDYSMTDDYAFDNANNFGRMTEWKSARIKAASVWEEVTLQNGNIGHRLISDDFKEGFVNFSEWEFRGKSGGAYTGTNGEVNFWIHSNEHWTLRKISQ